MTFLTKAGMAGAALMLMTGPAFAVSVSNQDQEERTLIVDWGTKQEEMKVGPDETVEVECPNTCGFRTDKLGYGRQASGDDKLIIQDGQVNFPEAT